MSEKIQCELSFYAGTTINISEIMSALIVTIVHTKMATCEQKVKIQPELDPD